MKDTDKLKTLLKHIEVEEKDGELHIKCNSPVFFESLSHGVFKFNGSLVFMTDSKNNELLYLNPTVSNYGNVTSTTDIIKESHNSYNESYNNYLDKKQNQSDKDCKDCE